MTRDAQKDFVIDLTTNIADTVLSHIIDGKIPEEWDGNELRVLLANMFTNDANISEIKKFPQNKRAKDFENICLTKIWNREIIYV